MSSAEALQDIAGARVTSRFLSFAGDELVVDVKSEITTRAKELDTVDYIYVVNEQNQLQGVASIKEVLQSPDDSKVRSIMKKNPVSVDFHTDQERLIYLVLKYELKAIPVVDRENHLKGVVPYPTIMKIFHHEFREDILRSGGIHHRLKEIEEIGTPVARLVRARLPSLYWAF